MKIYISIILCLFAITRSSKATAQIIDTIKVATISVKGISCAMDLPIIKKKLINQEGVDEVTFSDVKNTQVLFTVSYHPSLITELQIKTAIEAAPSCDRPKETPYKVKSFTINKNVE